MRAQTILAGLVLTLSTGLAGANSFRQSAPAGGKALYSVNKDTWVVRAKLPANNAKGAAARIQALRQSMEDEIEAVGHFAKEDADTPAFEIVSHGATLTQVAEAGYAGDNDHQNKGVAKYTVKASDLQNGELKVTVMLPVSGHDGLDAKNFAKTNVFGFSVNGSNFSSDQIPAKGKYVTEVVRILKLKKGLNTLTMEPYANGFGGYTQGRTIHIMVQ